MRNLSSDSDLVAAVLRGQTQSYAVLVEKHQNLVFSIVLKYISGREDAEEVAQDVFIKAFKALGDFRGQSKFSTWLYTIATTTALSFLRKKKLALTSIDTETGMNYVDNIPGVMKADQIEQKSKSELIGKALKLLSSEDSQVIALFYQGEQTLDEIAKILGKEANTVKVQLHRARTRLKEKLVTHYPLESKDLL